MASSSKKCDILNHQTTAGRCFLLLLLLCTTLFFALLFDNHDLVKYKATHVYDDDQLNEPEMKQFENINTKNKSTHYKQNTTINNTNHNGITNLSINNNESYHHPLFNCFQYLDNNPCNADILMIHFNSAGFGSKLSQFFNLIYFITLINTKKFNINIFKNQINNLTYFHNFNGFNFTLSWLYTIKQSYKKHGGGSNTFRQSFNFNVFWKFNQTFPVSICQKNISQISIKNNNTYRKLKILGDEGIPIYCKNISIINRIFCDLIAIVLNTWWRYESVVIRNIINVDNPKQHYVDFKSYYIQYLFDKCLNIEYIQRINDWMQYVFYNNSNSFEGHKYISIHIRRTDKIGREASYVHVAKYFDVIFVNNLTDYKNVYIATDDYLNIKNEITEIELNYTKFNYTKDKLDYIKFLNIHFSAENMNITAPIIQNYDEDQTVFHLYVDLYALFGSNYFIGTGTSNFGCIVYYYMKNKNFTFSLDKPYSDRYF